MNDGFIRRFPGFWVQGEKERDIWGNSPGKTRREGLGGMSWARSDGAATDCAARMTMMGLRENRPRQGGFKHADPIATAEFNRLRRVRRSRRVGLDVGPA